MAAEQAIVPAKKVARRLGSTEEEHDHVVPRSLTYRAGRANSAFKIDRRTTLTVAIQKDAEERQHHSNSRNDPRELPRGGSQI